MDDVFELTDAETDIIARLEQRIPYREDIFGNKIQYNQILEDLVLNARYVALSRIYPFYDYSTKELPVKYANWQYRCAIELYNLADKQAFSNYSENGLSWSRLTDGISEQLLMEITSKAGIPNKVSEEDE